MNSSTDFIIENGVLSEYVGPGGDVVVPEGVAEIGAFAFRRCGELTGVTLPNGLTAIGDSAFEGKTGLTTITLPDTIEIIGKRAFANCTNLSSMNP